MSRAQRSALKLHELVMIMLADGTPMCTEDIAHALGTTPRTVMGATTALKRQADVVSYPGQRIGNTTPTMWRSTAAVVVKTRVAPHRPYLPPRPTVIPVRAGGALAPVVTDGPGIGMGHWTRNKLSPTEAFK
jgi:hypothetical protein